MPIYNPGASSGGPGSVTWDTVGAAAGSATTANGTNNIVYNTAPTADSKVAWTFGETSAATNGTIAGDGSPNQVLFKIATLAASTQSPLSVYSRANWVFSVSPSAAQIVGNPGTRTAPTYALTSASQGNNQTGMYLFSGNVLGLAAAGQPMAAFDNQTGQIIFYPEGLGSATYDHETRLLGFGVTGGIRQTTSTADAVAPAFFFRKSRGSVASPSVITTGDVIANLNGAAYLGATNTYRETGRFELTSAGTISDATTGVGSIWTLYGKTQGTDATVQPAMTITGGSTATLQLNGTGMFTANGATLWAVGSNCPAVSGAVAKWLTFKDGGGTTTYVPCFQ